MINLLPADLKEHYIFARRNSRLRRWAFALLFGLVGVGLVTTGGMVYTQHSIDDYSHQVLTDQDALKDQNEDQTRKQSAAITGDLKLVIQVLSREVLFSKLLTQIAAVTPANTSLTNLSISDVAGALDITAITTDYKSATQLQVNLQDPANQIFSRADIQSISCNPNPTDPHYPCTVILRALFAGNNPYLFINKASTSGGTTVAP